MTLIDGRFLQEVAPKAEIRRMQSGVTVRGLGNGMHSSTSYGGTDLFFPGYNKGKPSLAHVRREADVVDDLWAKMLIGMDILGPKGIIFIPLNTTLTIPRCKGLTAPINIIPAEPPLMRKVLLKKTTALPANTITKVEIDFKGNLSGDRDMIFYPMSDVLPLGLAAYAHVVDAGVHFVQVRNNTDWPV